MIRGATPLKHPSLITEKTTTVAATSSLSLLHRGAMKEGEVCFQIDLKTIGHVSIAYNHDGQTHLLESARPAIYHSSHRHIPIPDDRADYYLDTAPSPDPTACYTLDLTQPFSKEVSANLIQLFTYITGEKKGKIQYPKIKRLPKKYSRLAVRGAPKMGAKSGILKLLFALFSSDPEAVRMRLNMTCSHFTYQLLQVAAIQALGVSIQYKNIDDTPLSRRDFKRINSPVIEHALLALPTLLRKNAAWVGPKDLDRLLR